MKGFKKFFSTLVAVGLVIQLANNYTPPPPRYGPPQLPIYYEGTPKPAYTPPPPPPNPAPKKS